MGSQSLLKLDSSELQSLRQKESWVPSARCLLGLWFVALGKVSPLPDRALCPLNCQMVHESRKPKISFHLEQAKELTHSARRPRRIFHLHLTCPSSIPMDFLNFFFTSTIPETAQGSRSVFKKAQTQMTTDPWHPSEAAAWGSHSQYQGWEGYEGRLAETVLMRNFYALKANP